MDSSVEPVFIVGCPRSGTSVTKKIIRRHPDLASCGVEHHYILELADHFGRSTFSFSEGLEVFARSQGSFGSEFITRASAGSATRPPVDVSGFCAEIWTLATGEDRARPVVLQYAGAGLLRARELLDLFPRARFIVLTRDPRANVSSQLISFAGGRTTSRSVSLWKECRAAADDLFAHNPDVALDLRYEGLVTDSEAGLRRIVSFLELPWTDALLDFEIPMAVMRTDGVDERRSFTALEPAMLDKWREVLSPSQVALIERRCRSEMEALGYAPEGRDLGLADGPFLTADVARWGQERARASMARITSSLQRLRNRYQREPTRESR